MAGIEVEKSKSQTLHGVYSFRDTMNTTGPGDKVMCILVACCNPQGPLSYNLLQKSSHNFQFGSMESTGKFHVYHRFFLAV